MIEISAILIYNVSNMRNGQEFDTRLNLTELTGEEQREFEAIMSSLFAEGISSLTQEQVYELQGFLVLQFGVLLELKLISGIDIQSKFS